MPMRSWILSLALAAPLLTAGCGVQSSIAQRQALANAQFALERVVLKRADVPFLGADPGADLDVVLAVTNPNGITAVLDRLDYEVLVDGQPVGNGATPTLFSVAAGQTAELVLPL